MNSYYKGIFAENLAKILLLLKGYKIIDKRFKSRLGEVDIICLKKGVMIFGEVKQRRDKLQFFDIINAKQKNRIIKASQVFLKKNNFNVPESASFSKFSDAREFGIELLNMRNSLIIKPVDSSGSKGVTRVDNLVDFDDAFSNALNFSITGKVVVEEFIQKKSSIYDG